MSCDLSSKNQDPLHIAFQPILQLPLWVKRRCANCNQCASVRQQRLLVESCALPSRTDLSVSVSVHVLDQLNQSTLTSSNL